jgi:hypothetical protein
MTLTLPCSFAVLRSMGPSLSHFVGEGPIEPLSRETGEGGTQRKALGG